MSTDAVTARSLPIDAPALAALERVVQKYKIDVNHLAEPAPPAAVAALEAHLGVPIPPGLAAFLRTHNGTSLFRGALRVRAVADIARASDALPSVVLFADGRHTSAFTSTASGGFVLGTWADGRLEALHTTFGGWLAAAVDVLDTRVTRPDDQALLAFAADEDDAIQLMRAGERALRAGNASDAVALLQRALDQDDTWARAWSLLGDALIATDRGAARLAWREAFRRTQLPVAWPGAPCVKPDLLGPLSAAFANPDAWERELERFLLERVQDVRGEDGAALVEAVVSGLAGSHLRRGRRTVARDTLAAQLSRQRLFTWRRPSWRLHLALADLEIDLGNHDAAETLVRRLLREAPPTWRGPGLLRVARIAVVRHEPWAEDLLREAGEAGCEREDAVNHALLGVDRAVRMERLPAARRWLDRARAVDAPVDSALRWRLTFAEGDLARLAGDLVSAAAAWRAVTADALDPELVGRAHLRLGDLGLRPAEVEGAGEQQPPGFHYSTALSLFQKAELPLREAWALVRLARVSEDPVGPLRGARERFAAADLASGMAAVDLALGTPGASLTWHLERATRHARSRHDAQRCRPPWTRGDAERPERRLGAHRMALVACGDPIVDALHVEMQACVRAMGAGHARPHDPPVMRFVAAADLLASHRSYRASQVLLAHLTARATEGSAHRALQGAIARSPNVALADGLLQLVESASTQPAHAVAEAAELLGVRREAAATEVLTRLAQVGINPLVRRAAIVALGRLGDRSRVDVLVEALSDAALAEPAALSLLMLGDRRGVDFHGRALSDEQAELTGSPGEVVGRYGGPGYQLLLRNVAQRDDAAALGALQGLGLMGDPRGVPVLLDALAGRSGDMVQVAAGALEILTGHVEDMEESGARARWVRWWDDHGGQFPQGLRHRGGVVLDGGWLIARMGDESPWTRRTSYDELVITTGTRLPFDSDGPWRVQQTHLSAWTTWWAEHRTSQPSGGWYLDGDRLG